MRHGVHYAALPPSPPPSAATVNASTATADTNKMVVSVLMALFLPCAGMGVVFLIYICLLWYTASRRRNNNNDNNHNHNYREPVKPLVSKGLSVSELDKLPKVTGKELETMGRTECAVCLEEIERGQPARLVPGCNHGFHLPCADTWLSENSVCPVCRAVIQPRLVDDTDGNLNPT